MSETAFFSFDQLTWTEVAALPRNTPLVIPFGSDFSKDALIEILDYPKAVGLLPAIPFGWRGSFLEVEEKLLLAYVDNLLNSLQDDGFTRVFALTPKGVCTELGARRIVMTGMSQPAWLNVLHRPQDYDKVVLIPIGHTEQHSYHLPLNTDTLIIHAIAQGVQSRVPELALALPTMPYGVSTHRTAFAGTLNAGGRAFEDFWLNVIDRLIERGFRKFYLLSGHGGNCSFLTNVVKYAGERHYQAFVATAWLYLSGPRGIAAIQQYRQSPPGGMGHACELETSIMLFIRPDLVRMERVVDEVSFISTDSYSMDWVESGALIANPPWEDDIQAGAYGAGSLGTAEKGETWLNEAIEEKIDHVKEIHHQYAKRILRRKELGKLSDYP